MYFIVLCLSSGFWVPTSQSLNPYKIYLGKLKAYLRWKHIFKLSLLQLGQLVSTLFENNSLIYSFLQTVTCLSTAIAYLNHLARGSQPPSPRPLYTYDLIQQLIFHRISTKWQTGSSSTMVDSMRRTTRTTRGTSNTTSSRDCPGYKSTHRNKCSGWAPSTRSASNSEINISIALSSPTTVQSIKAWLSAHY